MLLLGALVFFHELGHFTMAKLLKIRVDEFAFGFGPKWIRLFKLGDTEYTIHPLPLGGFVKLAGEAPGEEPVPDGFNTKPWYQRFLVYLAGPMASFILAYLIFCTLGFTVGLPTGKLLNRVDMVEPGSRAAKAGLRVGDKILQIDGQTIKDGTQMVDIVHKSIDKPLAFMIQRDSTTVVIHATPQKRTIRGETFGAIGFVPTVELKHATVAESIEAGNNATYGMVKAIVKVLFSKEVAQNVGGPIQIANATRDSVKRGVFGFLQLMGMLSLSLGVFNLLPIPVVDGGQMVLSVAEGIKGGKLSQRTMELAQFVGLAVIALIFVAIMFLDLQKLASGQLFQ